MKHLSHTANFLLAAPWVLVAVLAVQICWVSASAKDKAQPQQDKASLNDSVREAERDGSRVLRAESIRRDGNEVHRMKVMTPDGRVRVLRENAGRNDRNSRSQDNNERDE